MPEPTLEQILKKRDERVIMQKKLLEAHSCPLISFTMNIAGPTNTSPLIKRAFLEGVRFLDKSLPKDLVLCRALNFEDTGFEAMFSVNLSAKALKDICVEIEEATPLGRLFDMDVLSPEGEKLERNAPRRCLICGGPVFSCSSRRTHSVAELKEATNKIICDYFEESDRKAFASLASKSLLDEVSTTPKPGLVDKKNSGSHTDMDFQTFLKSIDAISPYFLECIKIGQSHKGRVPEKVFPLLKEAGIKAEETMFSATKGVNTHKGAIYSFGILLGSLGMLWTAENPVPPLDVLLKLSSDMVKNSLKAEFSAIGDSSSGGRLFLELGIKGIRGEVASGFSSVVRASLPIYEKALHDGLSQNDAGLVALLHLIASVDDTNVYNRGKKEASDFAKSYAKNLLESSPYPSLSQLEEMDRIFISKNISPGGSADLLAVTYFLSGLKSIIN